MPNISIRAMSWDDFISIVREPAVDHWDEVGYGDFNMKLDLDEHAYSTLHLEGMARFYVAFVDDIPVGYTSLVAAPMLKFKGIYSAMTDAFYVAPNYRGTPVFITMLKFMEDELRGLGVKFFIITVSQTFKHTKFLAANGYQLTEKMFTKDLQEN